MNASARPARHVRVRDRVRAFYRRFPTGSIRTELVRLDDDIVVFKAMVYRDPHDPRPTTGWAYERPPPRGRSDGSDGGAADAPRRAGGDQAAGDRTVQRLVERCETAAVGRALANRNFAGPRRPSWEEMEKVRRMRAWQSRLRTHGVDGTAGNA